MEKENSMREAKLPLQTNHIRIRRTVCDICEAGCNIDAYVENGTVVKVTGCKDGRFGSGYLCARGHASRAYVYHAERLKTPLRRIGKRGEGKFEPISWEEAMSEVSKRLLECRARYDAGAVAFTGGGSGWTRAALARLAASFGSVNYGSARTLEKSGAAIASGVAAGVTCRADVARSGVVLLWGCNVYGEGAAAAHPILTEGKGAHIIVIDPRVNASTCRLANLHLRPRPGTDAALAHGLARLFVEMGYIDRAYIERHVQGYFEYRAYINDFTPQRVEELTGVKGLCPDAKRRADPPCH
jgi:anaerobic selenocysteine-containing dehydrogenase